MSDASMGSSGFQDRRICARRQTSSLAYVDLGEDNGGLVLNMSEGGIAVHAAVMLAGDQLPKIRFQLPQSQEWVESAGHVTWTGDSKKEAGIQFVGLPEEARTRIRNWLSSSESSYQPPAVRRRTVDARKLAALASQLGDMTSAPAPDGTIPSREIALSTAARGNEARESAAVRVARKKGSREIGTPIVRPASARTPPWLSNSTFTFGGQSAEVPEIPTEPRRSRLALAGAAFLLTTVSFTIGLATGDDAWRGILASARNWMSSKTEPIATPEAPAAIAPGTTASESQASSSGAKNISGVAPQSSAAGSTSRNAPVQLPGGAAAQPQSGEPAPQRLIVHRAAVSPGGNASSAPADQNSSSVLSMPDTPLSASNSIAVSSRLYIPVPDAAVPQASQRGGNLQIGRLESQVEIVYPPDAEAQRIEGIVKLHVTIGTDGAIESAVPLSGATLLASAALDAVRQWRYKPTMMDGQPIETEADITVVFRLPQPPQ